MHLKNFSLLYVEDDPDTLEIIGDLVKEKVSELYLARDGKEGLASFKQHRPDIILTDINMPNLNGIDMSEAIKSLVPEQPVIILTAFTEVEHLKRAINIGIDKYVVKPITNAHKFFNTLETVAAYLYTIKKVKSQQEELTHLAYHDALTNLPNRFLFNELMQNAMHRCIRNKNKIALLYIDLDGFKAINDQYGHDAGDKVLKTTGQRIQSLLRQGDIVARLGGDEFVIAIAELNDNEEIFKLIRRVLNDLSQTIQHQSEGSDAALQVSASIGVTYYPQHEEITPDGLLRQADQSMYEAKLAGKNQFHIFNIEENKSLRKQKSKLVEFENALNKQELLLHFQPQVNMKDGSVKGFEGLIRWQKDKDLLIYPASFISDIENDQELSIRLDRYVIDRAIKQLDCWKQQGYEYSISINISAYGFRDNKLINYLLEKLQKHPEVSNDKLELEVLESYALEDYNQVRRSIIQCQKMGIKVALDDFGTGYSTLNYLKQLPVNSLKVDQSFVSDMHHDRGSFSIIEASIGLAYAFDCEVVAEGVESIEQGVMLIQLGCSLAQGYYIARPMDPADIDDWLLQWQHGIENWTSLERFTSLSREAMYASIDLRQWISCVENYISSPETFSIPETEPEKCMFGKWVSRQKEKFADNICLIRINCLHMQMHERFIEYLKTGTEQSAESTIQDIKNIHLNILKNINHLSC